MRVDPARSLAKVTALLFSLGLFGATAGPSRASPPPDAPVFDAEGAFRQGLERHRAGDALRAVEIWSQVVSTLGEERAYKVLYNLGVAHQQLGEITRAVQRFEAFLRILASQPEPVQKGASTQREDAEARLSAIRASYGRLVLRAPEGGELVLVRVGGGAPEPLELERWLAPGEHTIELHSGTSRAEQRRVHVDAGKTTVVSIDPPPSASAPPPTILAPIAPIAPPPAITPLPLAAAPPKEPRRAFPLPWLLGGLGVTAASLTLPLVLRSTALDLRGDAEGIPRSAGAYPGAVEDYEIARRNYYLSYALPASLAVATVIVVVVAATRDATPRSRAHPVSGEGSAPHATTPRVKGLAHWSGDL